MYGFPSDLNLKNLVGRDLNLLGMGRYDVQLNFTGSGIKICVQGRLSLLENGKTIATWNEDENWSSLDFQRLLNATVEGYSVPNEKLLEIRFTNGLVLQLHDDSDQYEVVQIGFDDESNPPVIV